jgi:hypothetical protein
MQTYEGYRITELRRYASEYKIPGRSKMNGRQLLDACREIWHGERDRKQNAVILAGPVGIGTKLRFVSHPGCVIVATSELLSLHGSLYVHGEYVSECQMHNPGGNRSVDLVNRQARGDSGHNPPWKFYLHSMEHVPAEVTGERIEVGADGCGCPISEEVTANGSSVEGTERTEHVQRCWLAEHDRKFNDAVNAKYFEPAQFDLDDDAPATDPEVDAVAAQREVWLENCRALSSVGLPVPSAEEALYGEHIVSSDSIYWAQYDLAVWRVAREWTGVELIERQGRAMLALI